MKNLIKAFVGALVSVCIVSSSFGQIVFDEAVDGEISNSGLNPTVITLGLGNNTVVGSIGDNGQTGATDGTDGDFFTFNLATGLEVHEISTTRSAAGRSFFGYNPGTTISSTDASGLVAGGLFGDLESATAAGSTFDPASPLVTFDTVLPLGAGDHSFIFQEIAPPVIDYSVTFYVVPEPSSAAILLVGLALMVSRRRRN